MASSPWDNTCIIKMSLLNRDEEFICALKKNPQQRTSKDLEIIYTRLHRFEPLSKLREPNLRKLCTQVRYERHEANEILYGKDDPCTCWFIVLSGSIFTQGSMFLRNTSFGRQIPGTTRRGSQCLVLEPSEMIAIDYPDMHSPLHGGGMQVQRMRNQSSESKNTLGSLKEAENSSEENSPKLSIPRHSIGQVGNGQAVTVQQEFSPESIKDEEEYYDDDEEEDVANQDDVDQDDAQSDLEEEDQDSISLHSSSSLVIKDLVIDVLKKDISDRTEDDHDVLLEFTRSLQAFSNMTERVRRELCKVMVFAHVQKAGTTLLKDQEPLDSWSVIINGHVQVTYPDSDAEAVVLYMGESFGVTPNMQSQLHKGTMTTVVDDCQFVCIAQQEYCEVLLQGKENMENVIGEDGSIEMVKEKRAFDGGKKGHIVIRGTPSSLRMHLFEENSIDTTYAEDYLLTYRAFSNEPVQICQLLLDSFDKEGFQAKVTRVILLWVNNHFNDFECNRIMMDLLEKFEEKLQKCNKIGECRLFNIACSTKAKSRIITLSRSSHEEDMGFTITGGTDGYPIYILKVVEKSKADEEGLKKGDQLLNVNGQNFEKLNMEKANAILRKNTDLTLTVKTNLFAFKEMMTELKNPHKKKDKKKTKHDAPFISQISTMQPSKSSRMSSATMDSDIFDQKTKKAGTLGRRALDKMNKVRTKMFHSKKEPSFKEYVQQHGGGLISETDSMAKDDSFLSAMRQGASKWSAATIDGPRSFKQAAAHSSSNPDLLDPEPYRGQDVSPLTETPEDVIKVFRADQSCRFVFVNQDTTAEEAVREACKEFAISAEQSSNYSLCRVTVQNETFVKQSKLPDKWSKLSEIPLSARYYLKNNLESEQLLPDENIPDVLKEANYTFLDLNCFEVALHLTLQDYELFKKVEQTDFIDDLFHLNEESLANFKAFENLVNRELFWVVSTICMEPNVIRRAKMIKHFTRIAQHCKALKNLNSTFAIISGLGYRAVSRMKSSWEKVPAKVQRTFEDLQSLMDPSRNMSKYRTLLNDLMTQPPVLPYVPVVKKDLTFLHLGNDTKVEGLVNFEKMRMIGREVRNVCRLCSADSSQIFSTATSHIQEPDRPASSIYHTLTRRGRRSSFNNARRMYEDAVNARRVKQYMQQLQIEVDEDKLMEMSKQVEPAPVSSAQTKRKNAPNDSPLKSSKTLPGNASALKRASQGRNNSEPQISIGQSVLAAQTARKKNPVSSLPKFGTSSPQAIRKLLALSEENGDGGSSGSSKRGSLEQRRSASSSSRELSPATSPYLSPKRDMVRSKGSISSSDSGHSVAHENTNRNNNRGHDFSSSTNRHHKHLSHPVFTDHCNPPSARSSISSTSSLGISSLSLNAPGVSSSNHSLNSPSSPRDVTNRGHLFRSRNSPVRSSSSSSTDTVKSGMLGRRQHEHPVSLQGRSGSYGALSGSDRHDPSNTAQHMLSASSSSPSLAAKAAASQHHLMLLSQTEIPRSPSMDSGVVSMGSLSADSTRFLNSESGEIFRTSAHRSLTSLTSSEGFASQQHLSGSGKNESPVMRRHMRNQMRHDASRKNQTSSTECGGVKTSHRPSPDRRVPTQTEDTQEDDIKQTFLSGSRGWGDAPLMRDKDPWPAEAMISQGHPSGIMVPVGEMRTGPKTQQIVHRNVPRGYDIVDGQYHQQRRMTYGGTEVNKPYYDRLRSPERPCPPMSLKLRPSVPRASVGARTPDSVLNEYQSKKSWLNKSFDSASIPGPYPASQPLCDHHSASFGGVSSGYPMSPASLESPVGPNRSEFALNLDRSDPLSRYHEIGPLSNHYPRYSHVHNNPSMNSPLPCSVVDTHRTANAHCNPNFPSDPRVMHYQREVQGPYVSDFCNPNHKIVNRGDANHPYASGHARMVDHQNRLPSPFHCPKHGSPLYNPAVGFHSQGSQSLHGVPEFSSLPLPSSLSNMHDTPTSRLRSKTHQETALPNPASEVHSYPVVAHSRSASDISLHTSGYQYIDGVSLNNSADDLHVGGAQEYPSPIKDRYMDEGRFQSDPYPSAIQQGRFSGENGSVSSTPKSQYPTSTVRRKSSEWAVTELDKENQQQAMQVWNSSSSALKSNTVSAENTKGTTSPGNNQSSVGKRKKPPPPLPPQRNSSYGVSRQLRLSSSTLSPLSSPPNSPTTPVSHTKISLSETHPQLVVKTMPNGPGIGGDLHAHVDNSPRLYDVTESNDLENDRKNSSEQSRPRTRTLPSYSEAINHLSSSSPFSPNSKLPSYQAHRELTDAKDRASKV